VKSFLLLIAFFTRLPVPQVEWSEEGYRRAVRLLPLVGLIIGALLAVVSCLRFVVSPLISAVALLFAYALITGGLHFDGLADTCDGMFSGRTRERSLEIMKDSRIGTFGVLGLLLVGFSYVALFTQASPLALLVFPVVGRAAPLLAACLAPYARSEGMGKTTALSGSAASLAVALLFVVAASLLLIPLTWLLAAVPGQASVFGDSFAAGGLSVMPALLLPAGISLASAFVALACVAWMTRCFKRRLGGVTGDTFGALIELSSIIYLFCFVVAQGLLL
jgi:adenosylcobinamide-GDP ribazoletransferase